MTRVFLLAGASFLLRMCVGHILRSTCCGCGTCGVWRGDTCYGCLWQTSTAYCSRRRCLPRLVRTYAVTMICGTLSDVHTTYPLCGWTQSELATRVTRPISRMGIIVRGRFSAGVALASRYPEWQKGGKLHNPGTTSCGRRHPNPGE